MRLIFSGILLFFGSISDASAARMDGPAWKRVGSIPAALTASPMSGNPLAIAGGIAFACTDSGVFRSPDLGRTWTAALQGNCSRLAVLGGAIYAGAHHAMDVSSDGGKTWESMGESLNLGTPVTAFASAEGSLFAGVQADGIYRSRDGKSWTKADEGLKNNIILAMAADGGRIHVGTPWGIFQSDDAGGSWSLHEASPRYVREFIPHAGALYAARQGLGVFRSRDRGQTWVRTHEALGEVDARGFAVFEGALFAAMGEGAARYLPERDLWEPYGERFPAAALGLAGAGRCLVAALADGSVWRTGAGCAK